jgi:hypothetical protein
MLTAGSSAIPFPSRPKSPPFVMLRRGLLDSPQWESLPALAQAAYVAMARKFTGFNNGQISFSARECAEKFNISKDTANRVLRLLEWRGLIHCTRRGSFNVKTQEAKTGLWELPEYSHPVPETEESLVRPQGPAGPTTGTSNRFPGPTTGTLYRLRNIDLRSKKADSRQGRKTRKEPQEGPERFTRAEWQALESLASKTNGDGQ